MQNKYGLSLIVLLILLHGGFAQEQDSTKIPFRAGGAVLVTNNGISLIPTFSLGEPAVLFNLYAAKGRLSFEPDIRFSFKGKPWSFLFWFRYRLVESQKFRVLVGIHPAFNFKTVINPIDSSEMIATRRFLAGELSPNYFITKDISVGIYYLGSRGFDPGTPRTTHFLTLNSNISNIKLFAQLYMRFSPQVYYLKQNDDEGYFATATVALARRKFPLSILGIFNKTIESHIHGSKDFLWSLSLVYSFGKVYVERK